MSAKYYAIRIGDWAQIRRAVSKPLAIVTYANYPKKEGEGKIRCVVWKGGKVLGCVEYMHLEGTVYAPLLKNQIRQLSDGQYEALKQHFVI